MIRFIHFPRCSAKQTTCVMSLFFIVYVALYVWVANGVADYANQIFELLYSAEKLQDLLNQSNTTKHVLLWNKYYLIITASGDHTLASLDCPVRDCMFTEDRNLLGGDYSRFDAIIFNYEITKGKEKPANRSSKQLYIFTTVESSYNQPVCEVSSENFFNWTFTYRLDSDVPWLYFVVTNLSGTIIAPSLNVKWKTSLEPVKPEIRSILASKKKTAAWLVSHCNADSLRDEYLSRLQEHLSHYGLKIDVYGKCNKNPCPNNNCRDMVKKHYRFYMAFENSFADDYVTEKVLHGYIHYAVPIVYGGANYTRFLPPGSYINAIEVHPYNLAFKIHEAVNNQDVLESYFKWTNLYTIVGESSTYHPLCDLCEALHSDRAKNAPPRQDFRVWWNGQNGMKWCLPQSYWNETSKVNIDAKHIFKMY